MYFMSVIRLITAREDFILDGIHGTSTEYSAELTRGDFMYLFLYVCLKPTEIGEWKKKEMNE